MDIARFEDITGRIYGAGEPGGLLHHGHRRPAEPPALARHTPIWDGPIGWVISWPASHKAKHLAHNPAVSLAYIADKAKPVYVDGVAEWVDAVEEKRRIWELPCDNPRTARV